MKPTALLIDDDPLDLKSLQMLVESWDLTVVAVRSGADAMRQLAAVPIDLVVSDVRMPGMSGEEVVTAVADAYPGLPVVLITGKGDIRSAVKAMKLGAFDYVVKPPDEEEFRLAVERALEHSRLRRENEFLRAQLAAGGMYSERLIGRGPAMLALFETINRVARTDSTVLVSGETGTGKELVAQTVHYRSGRAAKPLIALNCASLNANLVESELFGHEKGAFTGAVAARPGRFEDADGGTLFLDEIGELELSLQAKLLRVLQEGEFERLGGNTKIRVDVRLLASTNRDLEREVKEGRFREDLYYRLRVIPIRVPSLRERLEDIPLLAAHFVDLYRRRYDCPARTISATALAHLRSRAWKGNVRELQHTVERAVVLSTSEVLETDDFRMPERVGAEDSDDATLQAALDRKTREHLLEVLDRTKWHKRRAADMLGIDRATLYRLLRKHSVSPPAD